MRKSDKPFPTDPLPEIPPFSEWEEMGARETLGGPWVRSGHLRNFGGGGSRWARLCDAPWYFNRSSTGRKEDAVCGPLFEEQGGKNCAGRLPEETL